MTKVVYLTPPVISPDTIAQKLVCTRPMRNGRFQIGVEKIGMKTVVHCYGHGGSGWTTLFGSVNQAIQLFEKQHPQKSAPIRIIGSGCMGLTVAVELARLGYIVKGICSKELYDTPSWRAAGYFALVSVQTAGEEQENLNEIGMNTFFTVRQIAQGQHPYFTSEAVREMPVYCSVETESGVDDLEKRGLIPRREDVTLDFGNGVVHPKFVKYISYLMDTTLLMRQLLEEIKRLGIPVEVKKITSFNEVPESVVFNCSGMGSRLLAGDNQLIPVRGHLIVLSEGAGKAHMDYMIYTKVMQENKEEYIYMFPKRLAVSSRCVEGLPCAGVLGGTFIQNVDKLSSEKQEALDATAFRGVLERNCRFFHG